jgi:hypothetical protein
VLANAGGSIVHTADGGTKCTNQHSGTSNTLSSVAAVIPEPASVVLLGLGGLELLGFRQIREQDAPANSAPTRLRSSSASANGWRGAAAQVKHSQQTFRCGHRLLVQVIFLPPYRLTIGAAVISV